MNIVAICGYLTKDIELRYTTTGKAVARGSIALRDTEELTTFVNIEAWQKTAELMANYCRKGDKITIDGCLRSSSYEKDGIKRYKTYVVVNRLDFGFKPQNKEEGAKNNESSN